MNREYPAGSVLLTNLARSSAIAVVALVMLIFGATATYAAELPRGATFVWASGDEFVALVPQDEMGGAAPPRNAHPATMQPAELAAALSNVMVEQDGKRHPLLDHKAASRIAPQLAKAFARATTQQDVAFAAITEVKAALFGASEVSLAARAFWLDGRLQLIVADLHTSSIAPEFYRSPLGERKIDRRTHPHNIGKRARETQYPGARFVPGAGIELAAPGGNRRNDWLSIDLAAQSPLAKDLARTGTTDVAPVVPRSAPPAQRSAASRTMEERLLTLQQLRARDLISEEEYRRKREKILDEL